MNPHWAIFKFDGIFEKLCSVSSISLLLPPCPPSPTKGTLRLTQGPYLKLDVSLCLAETTKKPNLTLPLSNFIYGWSFKDIQQYRQCTIVNVWIWWFGRATLLRLCNVHGGVKGLQHVYVVCGCPLRSSQRHYNVQSERKEIFFQNPIEFKCYLLCHFMWIDMAICILRQHKCTVESDKLAAKNSV